MPTLDVYSAILVHSNVAFAEVSDLLQATTWQLL